MNEYEVNYENIKICTSIEEVIRYEINEEEISYTLKFIVLENGDYCQLNASLPFSFKSSWIKSCKRDKEDWVKYAKERLGSELEKRYKSIKKRDQSNRQFYKNFQEVVGKEYKECKEDFHHKYLYEKINDKYIGNIIKKIKAFKDSTEDEFKLTEREFKKMLLKGTCRYCGISMVQINQLSENGKLHTKRLRGYSMEIDQEDPYGLYTDDNCVASCYWCNNAKTDEFSVDEFKEIARGISKVWNKRLGKEIIKFPEETIYKIK